MGNTLTIVCFICENIDIKMIPFYEQLVSSKYRVCIITNNNLDHNLSDRLLFINLNNMEIQGKGYFGSTRQSPYSVQPLDKALFYFSKINRYYKNVWIIDCDTFITTADTLQIIDQKYPDADLICKACEFKQNNPEWYFWSRTTNQDLPWCRSLVPAVRLSVKMFDAIGNYVKSNKKLLFSELFYTTLAINNNMTIINPAELKSLCYKKIWKKEELVKGYIYHPVNIMDQHIFREYLDRSD